VTRLLYQYGPQLAAFRDTGRLPVVVTGLEWELRQCYGEGAIDLPMPGYCSILCQEVIKPFYIFILLAMMAWVW
jgi:hypothetical protein